MMKLFQLSLLFFLGGTFCLSYGQGRIVKTNGSAGNQVMRCGTTQAIEEIRNSDPGFETRKTFFEKKMEEWNNNNPDGKKDKIVVTIPVVVHVLWRTASQNLSDARIQEQIDVLNADYRKLNTDTFKVPSAWKGIAADCEVQFCLAVRDPDDSITTGIERRQVTVQNIGGTSSYYQYASGGLNIWDRNTYLNIWVCEIDGFTLGFSNSIPPSLAPASRDGIVIDYRYFGKTGTSAPFNLGRTTTHEVGHWLGLYHIWGDDGGDCSGSDNVSDTPDQADATYGCPAFPKTDACSSSSPGIMFMNYEDYSNDACMYMLTAGQKSRIWSAINGVRVSLKSSDGCTPVNQNAPPVCDFTASATSIYAGDTITFTDLSTNNPTSWSWTFSGGLPSTSNLQNPSVVYSAGGIFDVTLTASNAYGSCTATTKINYIEVSGWNTTCDTVTNLDTNDAMVLYSSDQWGYVAGHNNWGDVGFADYISVLPAGYNLSKAMFIFGSASYSNVSKTISVSAWDNTGTGGSPGASLVSQPVTISSISADIDSQDVTVVSFATKPAMSNPFYIGFEIQYAAGDTVGLFTTENGNTVPNTAWSKFSDNIWHAFSETPTNWGINSALAVWVELCNPQGIGESIVTGSRYVTIFPNPSSGLLTLITGEENFSIKIFDLLGKEIKSGLYRHATWKKINIDLSGNPAGIYCLQFSADTQSVIRKVILVK